MSIQRNYVQIPYFLSEEIAEHSWMIRNGFVPYTPALCYLIEGRDRALLIDTMMGWGDLNAYCRTLTDKPITLVNTHAHPDHTGGNFHFDACWIHHLDIPYFQDSLGADRDAVFARARDCALPEYREIMQPDGNFHGAEPLRVYPLYDGDVFDLGGRRVEIVEAAGHTPGSIVLIDHASRIAYTGDACNGNTLLEFENSLTVFDYMKNLLRLREHRNEFDRVYGGHEVTGPEILDEAIETVAKVLAGTDDHCPRTGLSGKPVLYAAEQVKGGIERKDGKRFNLAYLPDRIYGNAGRSPVVLLDR